MRTKRRGPALFILLSVLMSMTIVFCFPAPTYAIGGTEGNELKVVEASKLEIQLGTDWTGVEFKLKTDAGLYPGVITVGEDGVLRLEIGGSKLYSITCMNSSVSVQPSVQVLATEETQSGVENQTTNEEQGAVTANIPIGHIIFFASGMIVAIGSLITIQLLKKHKKTAVDNIDENDDEEEE